jgi:uncharacterized membrane protein
MRALAKILATGFFATLPVLLLYLLIGQLFDMMMSLTQPVVDLLPEEAWFLDLDGRARAAIVLAVFVFFVGLLALTKTGQRFGDWLEAKALSRLPLYSMLRTIAQRLSGREDLAGFRPALVETAPNVKAFAFVVEEHASGDFTIFMPIAPTPSVGYVQVVGREHVRLLNVKSGTALSAVLSWGDGAEATLLESERCAVRTEQEEG